MKIVAKLLGISTATLAVLFAVYYYNLDMKLITGVIVPFLDKHHDSIKREHII